MFVNKREFGNIDQSSLKALFHANIKRLKIFPCGQRRHIFVIRELNPLSSNSDQQQFSPNDVHTLSRDKVVRI